MRTTLIIQDELMAEAKQLAARQGGSVSSLVNEALREKLKAAGQGNQNERPFQMLTYGNSGTADDLLPETMTEMVAEDDLKSYGVDSAE